MICQLCWRTMSSYVYTLRHVKRFKISLDCFSNVDIRCGEVDIGRLQRGGNVLNIHVWKLQYTPLMVIYTFSQLSCGIKLQYTPLMVIYTFSKLSVFVFFWFNDLMLQMATAPINNIVSFKWFTNTSVIKSISSYVSPLSFPEKSRQRS